MSNINQQGKIGILTFYKTNNYGAVLQAYALQTTIEKIDSNKRIEIINYVQKFHPPTDFPELPKLSIIKPIAGIKNVLRFLWRIWLHLNPKSVSKRTKFDQFKSNHLNVSLASYNKREDFTDYKIVISGSDQVWNTTITKEDPIYYLDLPDSICKVSYAASFGREHLTTTEKKYVKQFIPQINYLSVREQSAVVNIHQIVSHKAEHVLDPTLLLNDRDWKQLCSNEPREIESPYLLIYGLQYPEGLYSIARKIAQKNKLKTVEIGSAMLRKKFQQVDYFITSAGPVEFVSLFLNADYIVTNSFHGLAFSINLQKEFICIPHDTRATRMISLLETLGIEDHLIGLDSVNRKINFPPLDYQKIIEKLDFERNKSLHFLRNALCNEQ